ncbi:MAG TPA: hypothetical protein VGY54_16940 [Polyangiaceae bacterium]|nr:hypothetical protein [Polyangiaceae bacterium]
MRPLKLVQQKLGLRMLSHHKVGRHSVASQALGSGAQRRLVEALKPARAPHEHALHVNLASTDTH